MLFYTQCLRHLRPAWQWGELHFWSNTPLTAPSHLHVFCITAAKYPSSVFSCFFCAHAWLLMVNLRNVSHLFSLSPSFNYGVVHANWLWKAGLLSLVFVSLLMKRPALGVFYVVWVWPCTYPRCLESPSRRSWLKRGVQGSTALLSCLHALSSSQCLL